MLPVKRWITQLVDVYREKEGRRKARIPADFQASLSGPFGTIYVTGVDATRNGAGVQSPSPLQVGTLVFLRISTLGLVGFAHVRHCSPRGSGYLLGLQFREGLARDREVGDDWEIQRLRRDAVTVWDESDIS